MSQLDWSSLTEEEKQKVQAYVLSQSTEGNPELPFSEVIAENKALNTDDKTVIGAINEIKLHADAAYNGTENFNSRFNTIVCDETGTDKESWDKIQETFGGNLVNAIIETKESLTKDISDVQSALNSQPVLKTGSVNVEEFIKLLEAE